MVEVGIFAAKALVILFSVGAIILLIAVLTAKASHKPELSVEPLHKHLKDLGTFLKSYTLSKEEFKAEKKKLDAEKKLEQKKKKKEAKKLAHDLKSESVNDLASESKLNSISGLKSELNSETRQEVKAETKTAKKLFVLNFKGDIKASQVDSLREEITAVLQLATTHDEVVVRLESPGGVVHGYGLAASQLLRFRERQIPLTVCVDKVAASGGYMMACVANHVVGAPFAIFGSIGVVAQVPNLNRLLKKHEVDYKEYTAGEFKRTVSMLGEITPKGEQKFLEQLEDTHELFKKWVGGNRPLINLGEVCTGEYWYGQKAKELGLIDEILTSDDYLLRAFKAERPIYEIKYEKKRHLSEKISDFMGQSSTKILDRVAQGFETQQFF